MKARLLLPCVCLLVASAVLAADDTYNLSYKFTPGETLANQITMSGTIPMDLTPGPEAGIPAMGLDMAMDICMLSCQVCKSVDAQGNAAIELSYPSSTFHTSIQAGDQPIEMLMTWDKGVLTNKINGQVQPQDENTKKLATILGTPMKMTMSPTGKATPDPESAKLLSAMMNASGGMTMDVSRLSALTAGLPDHPVKIGDTWGVQDSVQMGGATMAGNSNLKLAAIETFEGVKTARIEGEARLSITGQMPGSSPMGLPVQTNITRLDIAISFVNHFDLEHGNMLVSNMNVCQNMAMMISMGGQGGAQQAHVPATIDNAQMTIEMRRK